MDRSLDLDLAALELDRFGRHWSGPFRLEVGGLTWRDAAGRRPRTLHADRGEVQDPDSVGMTVKAETAEAQIVVFRGGWAEIEMSSSQAERIIENPSVRDVDALTGLLSGFLERFRVVARVVEEPLPLYGLPAAWRGARYVGIHATDGDNPDVWDIWEACHQLSHGGDDAIVVHSHRRAVHGGRSPIGPRVTGPESLIKGDAAFAVMLAALEAKLGADGSEHDQGELNRTTYELYRTSERIAEDASAWQPAELMIDGEGVDAIETSWDDWWVVLHIGFDEVADVYVYGPPGAKPNPLALAQVTADAYPELEPDPEESDGLRSG